MTKAWLLLGVDPQTCTVVCVAVASEPSPTTDLKSCAWFPILSQVGEAYGDLAHDLMVYAHMRYPWLRHLMRWDAEGVIQHNLTPRDAPTPAEPPPKPPVRSVPVPSVGRVVHYHDTAFKTPFAAIITAVHRDTVDLTVFAWGGQPAVRATSVPFEADVASLGDPYWVWPPKVWRTFTHVGPKND